MRRLSKMNKFSVIVKRKIRRSKICLTRLTHNRTTTTTRHNHKRNRTFEPKKKKQDIIEKAKARRLLHNQIFSNGVFILDIWRSDETF
jgi:hypothetical protein